MSFPQNVTLPTPLMLKHEFSKLSHDTASQLLRFPPPSKRGGGEDEEGSIILQDPFQTHLPHDISHHSISQI